MTLPLLLLLRLFGARGGTTARTAGAFTKVPSHYSPLGNVEPGTTNQLECLRARSAKGQQWANWEIAGAPTELRARYLLLRRHSAMGMGVAGSGIRPQFMSNDAKLWVVSRAMCMKWWRTDETRKS